MTIGNQYSCLVGSESDLAKARIDILEFFESKKQTVVDPETTRKASLRGRCTEANWSLDERVYPIPETELRGLIA